MASPVMLMCMSLDPGMGFGDTWGKSHLLKVKMSIENKNSSICQLLRLKYDDFYYCFCFVSSRRVSSLLPQWTSSSQLQPRVKRGSWLMNRCLILSTARLRSPSSYCELISITAMYAKTGTLQLWTLHKCEGTLSPSHPNPTSLPQGPATFPSVGY